MLAISIHQIWSRISHTPPVWLFVWAGLALLSISLMVLMRSRWGQSKPLQKCAVLSLLAHVLLACFATTFKLVGTPDPGNNPAAIEITVSWEDLPESEDEIVERHENLPATIEQSLRPTPWDDAANDFTEKALEDFTMHLSRTMQMQPEQEMKPQEVAATVEEEAKAIAEELMPNRILPEQANPSEDIPQTSDLAEQKPHSSSENTLDSQVNAISPVAPLSQAHISSPQKDKQPKDLVPITPEISPQSPVNPFTTMQPVATGASTKILQTRQQNLFRHRTVFNRTAVAKQSGGDEGTEAAVERALAWLAKSQSSDGRWSASRYGAGLERAPLGQDRRSAGFRADTGITGLALLAFLGAGHTHESGAHQKTVAAGIQFLLREQKSDGNLSGQATLFAKTYCHAMATFALAEDVAMTRDARLKQALERSIQFTIRSQHAPSGGWRYRPGDPGDTSQLGWQVLSLKSAERAGIVIPKQTWQGVQRFLGSVRSGRNGGLASYRPREMPSRTMSAEAAYCRKQLVLLPQRKILGQTAARAETTRYLLAEIPGDKKDNLYYWYYASLYLHGEVDANKASSDAWLRWNDAMKQTLMKRQYSTGSLNGAWPANTVWGGYGGRIYSTAMATLCLEVYYRYASGQEEIIAKEQRGFPRR